MLDAFLALSIVFVRHRSTVAELPLVKIFATASVSS